MKMTFQSSEVRLVDYDSRPHSIICACEVVQNGFGSSESVNLGKLRMFYLLNFQCFM